MYRPRRPAAPVSIATRLALLAGCGILPACATASGSDLYRLSEVDRGPEFVSCSQYSPPSAGSRTATVQVDFDVSETGTVMNPQALPSMGARQAGLVGTALVVARSCRYRPALKDGHPVAVQGLSRRFSFTVAPRAPVVQAR